MNPTYCFKLQLFIESVHTLKAELFQILLCTCSLASTLLCVIFHTLMLNVILCVAFC